MSAVAGIEGVSARYAAQIRELLYSQAIKRMAAAEEAARAEAAAERAARLEELQTKSRLEEPVKVDVESAIAPHPEQARSAVSKGAEPVRQPAAPEAPAPEPLAQIIDVQA
jgi:hypothetical protein